MFSLIHDLTVIFPHRARKVSCDKWNHYLSYVCLVLKFVCWLETFKCDKDEKTKTKKENQEGDKEFPTALYTIVVILCLKFLTSGDVNLYVNAWESYPALATLIDCCSIASWMLMRSCSLMLLNSSMQHKPPSAKTRAPASRCQSPPSFTAATVSPLETHSLYEVIHWYYM